MHDLLPAIAAAAYFLVTRQEVGGAWRDYPGMPIGASGGWVTAFVGRALAHECVAWMAPAGRAAARRGERFLRTRRAYPAGLGYNDVSGPDADSTAHGLALQQQLGLAPAQADVDWLLARWRPNGGCATYDRLDAWGVAHPCVTPVAWLALPPGPQAALAPAVRAFTLACRRADGTWPAYWWRGRHYSTFWNCRALRQLDPTQPLDFAPGFTDNLASAFDLACALGATALASRSDTALAARLLALQSPDGSWPGAPSLRVTHPACFRPWELAHGDCYTDEHRLVTTAAALDVLTLLVAQPED